MLRQFQFIDQNGKDQGINVRNRAKELADLLSDVERIRAERKKARSNKAKYIGVEGGGGFSSSSRYGGFGSESAGYGGSSGGGNAGYGGYSGGVYGDGGGFGGQQDSDFQDTQRRGEQFEEYDEFDEGDRPSRAAANAARPKRTPAAASAAKKPASEPVKPKEPEVDLFSFDEPAAPSGSTTSAAPASTSSGLASLVSNTNDDDEFDDFQSATPSTQTTQTTIPPPRSFASPVSPQITSHAQGAPFAQPKPVSAPQQANLGSMVGLASISPQPTTNTPGANYSAFSAPLTATNALSPKPAATGYQPAGPNYFTSVPVAAQPGTTASLGAGKPAAKPSASGGDAFGSLWSTVGGNAKKNTTPSTGGPAMGQLAKEKSAAGIWGAPAAAPQPMGGAGSSSGGNGLDSLL
jgi:epsin